MTHESPTRSAHTGGHLPLTPGQRGIWTAQKLFHGSTAFRATAIVWIDGAVDPSAFASSVSAAFTETEALRVRFGEDDGIPYQQVEAGDALATTVIDGRHADSEIRRLVSASLKDPVAAAGSVLYQRSDATWAWCLATQNILLDGYSFTLFIRRVAEIYSAGIGGAPAPACRFGRLADVLPAGSAAADERSGIDGYWRDLLNVDVDREASPPSVPDLFAASYHPVQVPGIDGLDQRLQAFARQIGTLWTDVLTAAFGLYLAGVDNTDHIAVRVPFMLRGTSLSRRTPCAMSRVLPVVLAIGPTSTVADVVRTMRDQIAESKNHADVEDHQFARAWPGGDDAYLTVPAINIKIFDRPTRFGASSSAIEVVHPGPIGRLDLSIFGDPAHGLRFELAGHESLTSDDEVGAHASGFAAFLDALVSRPPDTTLHQLVQALPAGAAADAAWSAGAVVAIPDTTVDGLLRAQVAQTPDAVAVVADEGSELTYARWDARVNALAGVLVERGVVTGDRVGVLLPRSVDLVVALAAIIRAGAAYVPVDPGHPTERVGYALADAGVSALVSDRSTAAAHRPAFAADHTVLLDDPAVATALDEGAARPPVLSRPIVPGDAVCVIYTSGTTGNPKGAAISHRALVNRLSWGREKLRLGADSVAVFKSGVGFVDASTELLGPLVCGATVLVVSDDVARDPQALLDAIRRHGVTNLLTVPSLADVLVQQDDVAQSLTAVRAWVTSGEVLVQRTADAIRDAVRGATVHNFYGSTEITGDITTSICDGQVTIGSPVPNTVVRVLDGWLRPVPVGVVGELYLGGVQLAEGYVGRFGLTAARFVADPCAGSGARLYRSGDLVRWNACGQLEFLGRVDDQVKIRGFRIEPAEIRSVLEQHDAVSGAVVAAVDHPAGGKLLVAYVTTTGIAPVEDPALAEVLRKYSGSRLPDHMVPAAFVRMDRFPVTVNGKLDRRALPAPDLGGATAGRAAAGPTELALAAVFREVLHLPDTAPSATDDFFRLGGHSMLATRLVARANARLGAALSLRDVFDHPTVEELAHVVDATSTESVPALRIADLQRPADVPVSFGQQAMWVIDQLGGPGGHYVVPTALRMSGDLDVGALEAALRDVVARHEPLRTLLRERAGQLVQVVLPADEARSRFALTHVDLAGADRSAVVARLVQQRFDLATDIPVRAGLLRVSTAEWVLVLAVHHHAVDEWSLPVLFKDLSAAYRARTAGTAPDWAPLRVQYAEYALWQRQTLGSAADPDSVLARHLDHWRTALAGAPEESTITAGRARPAAPTHRGDDIAFTVDPDTVAGLRMIADSLGVSMFMIAQAATALTVSALGGGDDVVIGSPVGGRTEDGLEDLVGYFVNTLPVRHRFHPRDALADVLSRTRRAVLDGFAHQAAPFEQIATAIGADRSVNRNPVFQVMLTHRNVTSDRAAVSFPGVDIQPEMATLGAVKTDLDLYLIDSPEVVRGILGYATDLFDRSTGERFVTVLQHVLAAISTDPQLRITDLRTLSSEVAAWSTGADVAGTDDTVDSLIRAQVSSEAVAVVDDHEGTALSYPEFDGRVNALATLLVERGLGVADRAAVLMPRSSALVVSLAAVIRAGAACVPMDPQYPGERIARILEDAAPSVVVTDRATAVAHAAAFAGIGAAIVVVDDKPLPAQAEPPALERPIVPDDAAYVIFTSGTTGRPKGVELSHRVLVRRLRWGRELLGLGQGATALWKSGLGFVDAATELFGPLVSGATVVVVSDDVARDPSALVETIRRRRATHLLTVPGLAELLTQVPGAEGAFDSLRQWVSSGEALRPATARAMRQVAPAAVLHNFYGSTEVTGDATRTTVEDGAVAVPIGSPVPNTQVRVLDVWLRPVPVGVVGELYVGGAQVAQGYVGRFGLTAERFVADPFSGSGARLYRTGDLVRWAPHPHNRGRLEYLGRSDDQVKLRGHRIELGEIGAALRGEPGVADALVVLRAEGRLVGYVVPSAGADPDPAELRAGLAAQLPDYMVPAAVVLIERIPLTVNGKVDRAALPAPDFGATGELVEPSTPAEHLVRDAFVEVLKVDRVGVHDDFFAMGGDSILAIRAVVRLRELGMELTPQDVFRARTVAGVAAAARTSEPPEATEELVALPIVHRFSELAGTQRANQSRLVGVPPGRTSAGLASALRALVERHDALRLRWHRGDEGRDGYWSLHVRPTTDPADWTPDVVPLPDDPEEARSLLGRQAETATAQLDPEHGPVLRAVLFEPGGDGPGLMLVVAHQLAVDHASWPILLGDLDAAWRAADRGAETSLPPVGTSLADYGRLVAEQATGKRVLAEYPHWTGVLAAAGDLVAGPVVGHTAAELSHRSARLPAGTTAAALAVLPTDDDVAALLVAGVTAAVVAWRGGPRELLIDLVRDGRVTVPKVDLSRTIGWLSVVAPVACTAHEDPLQLLAEVRRELAVPAVGFGMLRYLNPRVGPRLARLARPQVLVDYAGRYDDPALGLPPSDPRREAARTDPAPDQECRYALEVTGLVAPGPDGPELHVRFTASAGLLSRDDLDLIVTGWLEAVTTTVAALGAAHEGTST